MDKIIVHCEVENQNLPKPKKNNTKLLIILTAISLGFFGFGFAMVPLYNTFCRALGIAPAIAVADNNLSTAVSDNREIKIGFTTQVKLDLPIEFVTLQDSITTITQKYTTVKFRISNKSDKTQRINSIYSLTPLQSGGNIHKIECFCFTEQVLKPYEERELSMIFYVDNELDKYTTNININYAIYPVPNA